MEEKPTENQGNSKALATLKKAIWWRNYAWLALILFLIDIISKWVVEKNIALGDKVTVIPNFFYFEKTYNTYAAFGDWFGTPSAGGQIAIRVVLILISWVMSGVIAYYWFKRLDKKDYLMSAILMTLFAGAFGNLIDRTFYWTATVGFDGVIDFLAFVFWGHPFAIFNVADSCLTIGIIMLIVVLLVRDVKSHKGETASDQKKEQIGDEPKDDHHN
jgi:signal peptidase II